MNEFLYVGASVLVLTAVLAFARWYAERARAAEARVLSAPRFPPPVPWADAYADILLEAGAELARFAARRGITVRPEGPDVFFVHELPHPVVTFRVERRGGRGGVVEVLLDDVQMRFLRAFRGYAPHVRDGWYLSLCAAALEAMETQGAFWMWTDGEGRVHRSDLRLLQSVDEVALTPDNAGDRVIDDINTRIDKRRGGNGA